MYGVKFSLWLTGAVGPQAVAGRHSSTRPLAGGWLGAGIVSDTTNCHHRHAEIHRTSDNDEKKSQCPINVGKTPDKMSGISIYPQFVVKSLIFLWFHNELTSSITSSWSKVNKSAIIPETLILPNLPSWLKISSDFPYLWRHIHGNPRAFPGTRSYKREVFWQDRGNEGADWRRTR